MAILNLLAISFDPPSTPTPNAPSTSLGSLSTLKHACAMGNAPSSSRLGAANSPSVNGTASPRYPTKFLNPPAGGDVNPVANCNTLMRSSTVNSSIAHQKHSVENAKASWASWYAACFRQSSKSIEAAPAMSELTSPPFKMPRMRARSCGGTTAPNPAANALVWSRTAPRTL